MTDIISFFSQYENTIYGVLGSGLIVFGFKFYFAWRELSGSIFGLEKVNAQRRLNNSAIGMFLLILMGFLVFSLITFVSPGVGAGTAADLGTQPVGGGTQGDSLGPEETPTQDAFATATPLPTVVVDPQACSFEEDDVIKIAITSPRPNEEVRSLVEVIGIVDVEDFGYYKLEIAEANTGLWLPVSVGETLVLEETALVVFDSAFYPPGNYVLQLVVTNHDVEEYEPCRVPIRIAPTE